MDVVEQSVTAVDPPGGDRNTAGALLPCSGCHVNPRRPGQRTCHKCHAEYMRAQRRKEDAGDSGGDLA